MFQEMHPGGDFPLTIVIFVGTFLLGCDVWKVVIHIHVMMYMFLRHDR